MNADERLCPQCGEVIKLAAIKCKHCKELISENNSEITIHDVLQIRYAVKWTWKIIILGVFFWLLYDKDPDLLNPDIEWHLWSSRIPLVIPTVFMQAIYWTIWAIVLLASYVSFMPALKIIVDQEEIIVPSLLTRSYKTIKLKDIIDVSETSSSINIDSKTGNVSIASKLALDTKDAQLIIDRLIR